MSESSTMLDGDGDERGGHKGEDDDENDGDDGDGQLSIEITSFEGRAEHAMFDIPNRYKIIDAGSSSGIVHVDRNPWKSRLLLSHTQTPQHRERKGGTGPGAGEVRTNQ